MQAVAISATLHKTITVCSVYIPPNEEPKDLELNNLIEQLPRPFIIMGDFNSHNEIWGSKKTDKKGKSHRIFIESTSVVYVQQEIQHISAASNRYIFCNRPINMWPFLVSRLQLESTWRHLCKWLLTNSIRRQHWWIE